MRQPVIYTPRQLQKWDTEEERNSGGYLPSRPLGHNLFSMLHRWKVAWRVLIGKYDAVNWMGQR